MAFPIDVDATWANAPDASSEPVYDAADLRRADTGAFAGKGDTALGVRGGIVAHSSTSLQVTVDGSDVVTIQPGPVLIPGDAVAGTGCYRSALPTASTGSLTARHATLGRIDLVIFRMLDIDVVGTHTARKGRIEVIAGTPSGSPAVPAKPTMAVEIGRITVPATGGGAATVNLAKRTFATANGGELLVTTASELPTSAPPWQRARTLDTGATYTWDGTAWDDGSWTAFTPTLTGWTVGSGSLTGRIRYLANKTAMLDIDFVLGNGTKSGTLSFAIPFTAAAGLGKIVNGTASVTDTSAGDSRVRFVRTSTTDAAKLVLVDTAFAPVTDTVPFTFASTDVVRVSVCLEVD